jgi:probable addiction module antidote protein
MTRVIKRKTKKVSVSHDEATIASLKKDRKFAAEYLNQVLADGDQDEVLLALRRMADAFGGVSKLASATKLNATSLYRTLSAQGNPELKSLSALLKAMGLRLAVQPLR